MHKTVYYKVTSFVPFSRPSLDLYTRTLEKTIQIIHIPWKRDLFHYTDV
jgi:hypothetical protein